MSDINDQWYHDQQPWRWRDDGRWGSMGTIGQHFHPPTVQIPLLGLEERDKGYHQWRYRLGCNMPVPEPVDNWIAESPWGHKFMPVRNFWEYEDLATFCTPWLLDAAIQGKTEPRGGLNVNHMCRLLHQVRLTRYIWNRRTHKLVTSKRMRQLLRIHRERILETSFYGLHLRYGSCAQKWKHAIPKMDQENFHY